MNHKKNFEHKVAEIEVFYDGECSLCTQEIRMLMRLDKQSQIEFTDITSDEFDLADVKVSRKDLMNNIHGRLSDGRLIKGVDVFRSLYSAVGFRNVVAISRLPIISNLLDFGYRIFAKHRLALTGRCLDDNCEIHGQPSDSKVV